MRDTVIGVSVLLGVQTALSLHFKIKSPSESEGKRSPMSFALLVQIKMTVQDKNRRYNVFTNTFRDKKGTSLNERMSEKGIFSKISPNYSWHLPPFNLFLSLLHPSCTDWHGGKSCHWHWVDTFQNYSDVWGWSFSYTLLFLSNIPVKKSLDGVNPVSADRWLQLLCCAHTWYPTHYLQWGGLLYLSVLSTQFLSLKIENVMLHSWNLCCWLLTFLDLANNNATFMLAGRRGGTGKSQTLVTSLATLIVSLWVTSDSSYFITLHICSSQQVKLDADNSVNLGLDLKLRSQWWWLGSHFASGLYTLL